MIAMNDRPSRPQPAPVRLSFRRAAKGGGMTRIEGLIMHPAHKEQLLSELKRRFGCGGTIKDGALELQGDRRDLLEAEFKAKGFLVKRVGG